jgi:hypothetical protein
MWFRKSCFRYTYKVHQEPESWHLLPHIYLSVLLRDGISGRNVCGKRWLFVLLRKSGFISWYNSTSKKSNRSRLEDALKVSCGDCWEVEAPAETTSDNQVANGWEKSLQEPRPQRAVND